ncbi:hypothetical protein [Planomicrobium sp. CPCC 101079]|uniref:hypothetical protein n=1 Tax=Planomicrobium sp. CPCC 101079 TaxID=2599618 RepID=UPI0011B6FC38|nr:hypothetical protein [Planomicrobium sp. CPCC 101079]TWT01853.1 hypothetical protein FQV28_14570 [Planomicrobium sp. CPCC 101079]
MENVLTQAFNGIIKERVEDTAFLKVEQTPEYAELDERITEGLHRLKDSFTTDEQRRRLQELEEAWACQKALYLNHAYRQGLVDSNVLQDVLRKYEHIAK